jgi:hypothetical protein
MLQNRLPMRCLLATAGLLVWLPAFAQSQSRTIDWPKASTYNSRTLATSDSHYVDQIDEVEIESITVEGQTVIFGEPFSASDEWLKNLSFRVKNVSARKLTQFQITLIMPELGPMRRIQIQYLCLECVRKNNPISFDPGTSVDLTLPRSIYEWAKGIINENTTLSKITKAQVLVAYITNADRVEAGSDCVRTLDLRNRCPYGRP